ncbi:MAG: tRNA (adenosine(37)-N6)-threonylcarbamoyltransferase complex dimerization subunit type 1 TsaB [Clostridia bacterium]|nr:tRNA (adenosine(37)-N6)-threonylcarbamoyltransferase complex dimerization subunit type 1 TsaB [Clostridia bacterium]
MKILSIDTSGKVASVALVEDGRFIDTIEKNTNLSHSQAVLPVCMELLDRNEVKLKDIDCFASVVGPGSFTGLRIGIAAAKGFAMMLDKPLIGISSLECVAYAGENEGKICSLIRSRENEYFFGVYNISKEKTETIEEGFSDNVPELKEKYPDAVVVEGEARAKEAALLAYYHYINKTKDTDVHSVNPMYLKLSQAERMKLQENNK